jgi:glycogen debranching enzyme
MDVKIDGQPVTPRCGKPVEVNALWLNALALSSEDSPRWRAAFDRGRESFRERFWNSEQGGLFDVIDVDHVEDQNDDSFRPNQIFAVGGLPVQLLEGDPARAVVDVLESQLLTPVGLRSLSPQDSRYIGQCKGGPVERDSAYHQGTVWPWLLGPFVEAWLRVHGDSRKQRETARRQFLEPFLAATKASEIGHVPEIADGDAPHAFRGRPFQAWSLGELLRIERMLSIEKDQSPQAKPRPARNGKKT